MSKYITLHIALDFCFDKILSFNYINDIDIKPEFPYELNNNNELKFFLFFFIINYEI